MHFRKLDDEKVTPHFLYREFDCKCEKCRFTIISVTLILQCELLRVDLDAPVIINSAYRCPQHNLDVGGKEYSLHMVGEAVDLCCPTIDFNLFVDKCKKYFKKVIVYEKQKFCHCER